MGFAPSLMIPAPYSLQRTFRLVEDYGADNTGVTDSTAAWAAAIAAAATSGGLILVAAGTYKCNIDINARVGVSFLALGLVILNPNNASADTVQIRGLSRRGAFVGTWVISGPGTAGNALHINITFTANSEIFSFDTLILVAGAQGHCLQIDQTTPNGIVFNNLEVSGGATSQILIGGGGGTPNCNDVLIKNLWGGTPGQICCNIIQCIGFRVDNFDIESSGQSFVINPTSPNNVLVTSLRGGGISTNTGTAIALGGGTGAIDGITLHNILSGISVAGSSAGSGLTVDTGVSRLTVSDCTFNNNSGNGIGVLAAINNFDLHDNTCSANGGSGIVVNAAATDFTIHHNRLSSNTNTGIFIGAFAATHFVVNENIAHNNTGANYSNGATIAGGHWIFGTSVLGTGGVSGNLDT